MNRVFRVEIAHRTYGENYTSYQVMASGALGAIQKVKSKLNAGEYVLEVKHLVTLDV